ncbi:MAG: hypothetical protein NUW37_17495 [Planctomycetes bacterium]|nr:hypothetical protein [Planctomycetota bacterium]
MTAGDASVVSYYRYDSLNRMLSQRTVNVPSPDANYYDYDAVGNRTRIAIDPQNTGVSYYTYDGGGRMTRLDVANAALDTFYALPHEYDLAGNKIYQLHPHGPQSYFEYDAAGRLDDQRTLDSGLSEIAHLAYSRDPVGSILQIDKPAGAAAYYQYDTTGRVLVDHRWKPGGPPNQIDYYQYDLSGNRLYRRTLGTAAQQSYYYYDQNSRLTLHHNLAAGTVEYYNYDSGDRITERFKVAGAEPQYYYYDQEARTTEIRSAAAAQERFAWNSVGMKRSQGAEYYTWDGANRQSVHDENGDAINVSVYGPQLAPGIGGLEYTLDATGAPDSLEPVHLEDQVGTGGLVLKDDESTLQDYNFESPALSSFGEMEIGSIADGKRVLSEKEFLNPSTLISERKVNLYDFGARLYDPALGRFLIADPLITGIGLSGLGQNPTGEVRIGSISFARLSSGVFAPFQYVYSNTPNNVDPFGLWTWQELWEDIEHMFGPKVKDCIVRYQQAHSTPVGFGYINASQDSRDKPSHRDRIIFLANDLSSFAAAIYVVQFAMEDGVFEWCGTALPSDEMLHDFERPSLDQINTLAGILAQFVGVISIPNAPGGTGSLTTPNGPSGPPNLFAVPNPVPTPPGFRAERLVGSFEEVAEHSCDVANPFPWSPSVPFGWVSFPALWDVQIRSMYKTRVLDGVDKILDAWRSGVFGPMESQEACRTAIDALYDFRNSARTTARQSNTGSGRAFATVADRYRDLRNERSGRTTAQQRYQAARTNGAPADVDDFARSAARSNTTANTLANCSRVVSVFTVLLQIKVSIDICNDAPSEQRPWVAGREVAGISGGTIGSIIAASVTNAVLTSYYGAPAGLPGALAVFVVVTFAGVVGGLSGAQGAQELYDETFDRPDCSPCPPKEDMLQPTQYFMLNGDGRTLTPVRPEDIPHDLDIDLNPFDVEDPIPNIPRANSSE